jgi:hypothetical protein
MSHMRSIIVYLTLVVVLAVSIGVGFIASDWPRWCRMLQWCSPNGSLGH